MVSPLDVFAVRFAEPFALKESGWLDCAETVEKACELMRRKGAGLYCVLSQETGAKNFYAATSKGAIAEVFWRQPKLPV
jgi:hypothetical protein